MKRMAKPANELEGLIRDCLPDPVRRHLADVEIDEVDANGGPNWIGLPIWETDPSHDDKCHFIAVLHEVRRNYDLLTD
jgi:hypothetical protein